jgi:nucleoid-associated protein YgaU
LTRSDREEDAMTALPIAPPSSTSSPAANGSTTPAAKGGANPVKAYISVVQGSASGGGGETAGDVIVTCQFNPKEYTVQKTAEWKSDPAKGAKKTSMPEFQGAKPRSTSIEIFLDARGGSKPRDITKDIEKLFDACTPPEKTVGDNKPRPPFVRFWWGTQKNFPAIVKKVSAKYTLFDSDGTPLRAVCSVDLEEVPPEALKQNPTSGGLTTRKTHTVVAGDSLPSIAYREYGIAAMWRAIAEVNGIDDPLRLDTGIALHLPPADEAAAFV